MKIKYKLQQKTKDKSVLFEKHEIHLVFQILRIYFQANLKNEYY